MSATKSFTLNENFTAVATGAGSADFQGLDWDVEWTIALSATPGSILGAAKVEKRVDYALDLVAGEFLLLRGRGTCVVTADNVL